MASSTSNFMSYYVWTKHPITGEKIAAVPTGNKQDDQAEFQVITPQSNIDKIWLRRADLLEE